MLKNIIKYYLHKVIRSNSLWELIGFPFIRMANYLHKHRLKFLLQQTYSRENLGKKLPYDVVTGGKFEGMYIASEDTFAGSVLSYLAGSYENELEPVWELVAKKNYAKIIDIGCAEGYYAVGLARLMPTVKIDAYDTEPSARQACKENAIINGVEQQITIKEMFTVETIKNLDTNHKTLLLSDCEGYEKELFTNVSLPFLKNVDILIEMHDFIVPNISLTIKQLLKDTHDCITINSLTDIDKLLQYNFPVVEKMNLSDKDKYDMYAENRWPQHTEWCYFTSK
ncbi:MAG: methyltransferase [Thermoflexibacteraceae bacterium]